MLHLMMQGARGKLHLLGMMILLCPLIFYGGLLQAQDTQSNSNELTDTGLFAFAPEQGEKQDLKIVLKELEREYDVHFYFDPTLLEGKVANSQLGKVDLETKLTSLLAPLELVFKKLDEASYVIRQKDKEFTLPKMKAKEPERSDVLEKINRHQLSVLESFKALEQTISGKVTDGENGEPLPGVNVLAKGTTQGTVTDVEGNYSLTVDDEITTLIFSSIGYLSQEVDINGRTSININMALDVQSLNEVVVVGYGTVEKSDLTGSVSSLKSKDFNPGANASVDQLMLGRAAGVQINQTSSEPGGGLSIRIRGASSINAGSEPLYVIDGFPIDNSTLLAGGGVAGTGTNVNPRNPLNALNPNDIESIEILKDASATAIYGSRGANGVILVTTKKGNKGRAAIDYDFYVGTQSVAKKMDILSTDEYIRAMNEIALDQGNDPIFSNTDIVGGTDWQDQIYQTAPINNHNLSASGGDDNITFFASLNYFNQEGVIKNSGIKKYIGRLNLERKLGERARIGLNLNTSVVKDNNNVDGLQTNEDAGPIYSALLYDPTEPIYTSDGSFSQSSNLTINNPLSLIEGITSENETNRTIGGAFVQYNITDALQAKLNFGSDRQTSRRDIYNSKLTFRGRPASGIANITSLERSNVLLEYIMTYNKQLNENNSINILGGVTYQTFTSRLFMGNINGFPSDNLGTHNLGLGDTNNDNLSSNREENSLLSYLGRINYQLLNKFLITASLRADGSSRFGENNRFGYFPSFAFGWKLAEENFIPELFDDLKLRVSWGQTGNQEINNYASLSTFTTSASAVLNDQPVVGTRPSRIANPDLKWETTEQFNVGIDAGILQSRITGSVDYFVKNTKDMLINLPLPQSTGFGSILTNVGKMRNTGVEFLLSSTNINKGNFSWSTTLNFAAIRNEVTDVGEGGDIITGNVQNIGNTTIVREGYPVNSYYGYEVLGIFQNANEIAESAQPNSRPGFPIFKDTNGNNVISPSDQLIIGDPFPDFTYGIQNSLKYKNFQLDFFIQGQEGAELLNLNVIESMYPANFRRNRLAEQIHNRWSPENPNAQWPSGTEPSAYGGGKVNSLVLQDASYIRLKNVQISYNLSLDNVSFLRSARIYATGQNLLTLSDYIGFDPEANSFGRSNVRLDYSSYPLARTFLLGINIGL